MIGLYSPSQAKQTASVLFFYLFRPGEICACYGLCRFLLVYRMFIVEADDPTSVVEAPSGYYQCIA